MILVGERNIDLMRELFSDHHQMVEEDVIHAVVDHFYNKIVTESDQKLLDLAFNACLTQAELDAFLKKFDIECFGGAKALLLSYVMKMHPELHFDAYNGPRLAGLLRFYRFKNLDLISHYTKIGKALNAAGIKPLIFKGGAMKYLRPELPRTMGDIDVLIDKQEDYQKALKIVKDLGYEYVDMGHSVDLHLPGSEAGVLDIHLYLELSIKYDHAFMHQFFDRATLKNVFGVQTYVPCPEDLLFIALTNLVKNLRNNTSLHGVLYSLFDFDFLQKSASEFNWDIVLHDIRSTHTEQHMYTAILFVNKIIPGLLPEKIVDNKNLKKILVSACNESIFYTFYVYDVKMECKKLHLKNAFKSWGDFKHYMRIEGQHWLTKRIAKSQTLINLFLKIVH